MGNEFAATKEWNYTTELQWDLLTIESHAGMRTTVQALNEIYKNNPALFELQFDPKGFEWVEINKREEAVIAFKRKGLKPENDVLVIMNMTPVPRHQFPIHVQGKKVWSVIFNSDEKKYWGAGDLTNLSIQVIPQDEKGGWNQLSLNLPALSAIVLV
jgi:1,4-alpha-glucan branching enzyme